jgi:hypothetical protein
MPPEPVKHDPQVTDDDHADAEASRALQPLAALLLALADGGRQATEGGDA